jgi:outer membrane murein-binding lipoprotein Lpp
MKRIMIALAMGALGALLLAPCVNAQSWGDIQSDRAAIATGHARIRHDRRELRWDLRHGDYAAAAHEQAEINRRRERIRARQADLYRDLAARDYSRYHHYPYGWHHYYDED